MRSANKKKSVCRAPDENFHAAFASRPAAKFPAPSPRFDLRQVQKMPHRRAGKILSRSRSQPIAMANSDREVCLILRQRASRVYGKVGSTVGSASKFTRSGLPDPTPFASHESKLPDAP